MLDLSFYSLLCFTVLLKYLSWFSCTHNPFCICMLDKVVFHFVFYSLFNEIASSSKKKQKQKGTLWFGIEPLHFWLKIDEFG